MKLQLFRIPLALGLLLSMGCHPGPVIDPGPKPASVDGTIAGIVSTDGKAAVPGRKVTATNTVTGTRFVEADNRGARQRPRSSIIFTFVSFTHATPRRQTMRGAIRRRC